MVLLCGTITLIGQKDKIKWDFVSDAFSLVDISVASVAVLCAQFSTPLSLQHTRGASPHSGQKISQPGTVSSVIHIRDSVRYLTGLQGYHQTVLGTTKY